MTTDEKPARADYATRFQPGRKPTVRRAKGTVNHLTRDVKKGILDAAVAHGRTARARTASPASSNSCSRKI